MAFFRLPDHYVFDYKPIFYDPKKEEREKRVQRIKKELGIDVDRDINYKPDINFRRTGIYRKRRQRASLTRFLVIFTFFMIVAYILIFTNYFDFLVKIVK
jgi:hypothetical protein